MQRKEYNWRGVSCVLDDSTQYATVYSEGHIVGTIIRAPVLSRDPYEWSIYNLEGVCIKSANSPLPCLSALSKHIGLDVYGLRAA